MSVFTINGLKVEESADGEHLVIRWNDVVELAQKKGIREAEDWDVRCVDSLLAKLGIKVEESMADYIDIDPISGEELEESEWFIFLPLN